MSEIQVYQSRGGQMNNYLKLIKNGLRILIGVCTLGISELWLYWVRATERGTKKRASKKLENEWNSFVEATDGYTKKMVVRTYGVKEQKRMEKEGSALLENDYIMQGQSGFAENRGVSWTSVFTANRSKGITTITFIKNSPKGRRG
jgi:hypothetical protein